MNASAQWNQYRELEALHQSLGSLFSRSPIDKAEGREEPMRVADWAPLVDISEDNKEYLNLAKDEKARPQLVKVSVS